jgi:hypothetical protein
MSANNPGTEHFRSVASLRHFCAKSEEGNGGSEGYDGNTLNMLSVTCAGAMGTRESDTTIAFTHGNVPSI